VEPLVHATRFEIDGAACAVQNLLDE